MHITEFMMFFSISSLLQMITIHEFGSKISMKIHTLTVLGDFEAEIHGPPCHN